MTHTRHTVGWGRWLPLGIVGPGVTPSSGGLRHPDSPDDATGSAPSEPRRFIVPPGRRVEDGAPTPEGLELRRILREGGLLMNADRASIFIFGEEGREVRQLTTFHLETRRFEGNRSHPPRLRREVLSLLASVSRIEVTDLREQAPPPGAMRSYLERAGVRGLLTLPLRTEPQEIVGFVTFEVTSGPRSWSSEDRTRATELTRRIERLLKPGFLERERAAAYRVNPEDTQGERRRPADSGAAPPASPDPGRRPLTRAPASRTPGTRVPDREDRPTPHADATPAREFRQIRTPLPKLRPMEASGLIGLELGRELRSLLDVHEGLISVLEQSAAEAPGSHSEVLHDLREISQRAGTDLDTLLSMARGGRLTGSTFEIGRLFSDRLQRFAAVAGADTGVRLLVSPSVDTLAVYGRADLLARAFEHLIRNARTAVRGEGRIRISWRRALVPTAPTPPAEGPAMMEVAQVEVDDDGRGIRREHLPWIFEPGFSSSSEARANDRDGMGLPVVQAIVESHGGWLDLFSRPGEGTRITVNLPLEPESPRSEGDPVVDRDLQPGILLIQDEPVLGRFLSRVLEEGGYTVRLAGSLAEAEAIRQAEGDRIRLFIVEQELADSEDGVADVLSRFPSRASDVPVLALDRRGVDPLSTGSDSGDAPAARGSGRTPDTTGKLITPPFRTESILETVRAALADPVDQSSVAEERDDGGSAEAPPGAPDEPGRPTASQAPDSPDPTGFTH